MKKLTKLVLSLIIAISTFCIPIYAEDETVTNEMEYILPEQRYEEFIDQLKIGVENEIGSSDFKILGYRKQNYLEEVPAYQTQEYIGETTQIRNVGYASNQYPQGVTFSNGGTIYYSDSTGSDVSLSFSISGYGVSVGVGLGKKASGVTGYALNCPALFQKKAGKLQANFIEGMACVGGCIGGAGCLTHGEKNKAEVDKYGNEALEKTIADAISVLK